MSANDGGPAFPEITTSHSDDWGNDVTHVYSEGGMSLRDYFAAHILPAVYARSMQDGIDLQDTIAEEAYELADAMLEARKPQP